MRGISTCEDRLKSMIMLDKSETPQKINNVLKSEILYLLNNYFDISADDLDLEMSLDENGNYCLSITANARFLKIAYVINR